MSISPTIVKQAITEAYDPNNAAGKQNMWNTFLKVMRSGLSWENGNPWKDILSHWSQEHKKYEQWKRDRYHVWNYGEGKHWNHGGHHYRHHGCGRGWKKTW